MISVDVRNLTFSYRPETTVLRDISFTVSAGEVFVIAGLSGSGKTTLCQILSGVIPHAVKGHLNGQVRIMDIEPSAAGLPQTALKAGMVFQDVDSQLICTTVEDELAFGLENLCRPAEDIRRRVEELLDEFGLSALRLTNPADLSGGQKKLLTIAAVLTSDPPVLILDEPMSGLDDDGRQLIRTTIETLRDKGRSVIIVEHDLKYVTFADKWLLLENGAVVACGTPSELLERDDFLTELGVWE